MPPLGVFMLGIDPVGSQRRVANEAAVESDQPATCNSPRTTAQRPARTSRRATSHFNAFQTSCQPSHDEPPAYPIAVKHRNPDQFISQRPGTELPPAYSCSIAAEGRAWLKLESYNPVHGIIQCPWKEVYLILRGPLLVVHRVKDGKPGKVVRSYTLQHAEIGIATDVTHTVLVPRTRWAHLIPASRRERAWQKDRSLYQPVTQSILRLRAETDQMLLATEREERIFQWIHSIGAAIDIASPIDERSIPRQCTVPRRRRRRTAPETSDVDDPTLRAEQERILREMYPAFAAQTNDTHTSTATEAVEEPAVVSSPPSNSRDEDEIDLAVMREDFTTSVDGRPGLSRQTTTASATPSQEVSIEQTATASNLNENGKWEPSHPRTAAQIQRYVRRCIPLLLIDAPRASDVLICHGRRVRINWRMELLEEWELKPPSYRSHKFIPDQNLCRTLSSGSASDISTSHIKTDSQSSQSCNASIVEHAIEPISSTAIFGGLELTKVHSHLTRSTSRTTTAPLAGIDVPGVVFCF